MVVPEIGESGSDLADPEVAADVLATIAEWQAARLWPQAVARQMGLKGEWSSWAMLAAMMTCQMRNPSPARPPRNPALRPSSSIGYGRESSTVSQRRARAA